MKSLAVGFILGDLVLASCLFWGAASTRTFALPEEMQSAVGHVVTHATTCSVTCGLGYKEETVCEMGPDGVKRNCSTKNLECLTNWYCGMLHFTALRGEKFELSCLGADILRLGHRAFRFTWRLARGIISSDDELFKPLLVKNFHSLKFKSVREHDSGTYRCDVQLLRNLKLVKRLYFGLRVLPPDLVNLNFYQSLTEGQKLIDEGLEVNLDNYSRPLRLPWKRKVAEAVGAGIAIGVAGVLVSIILCNRLRAVWLSRKSPRSASPALPLKAGLPKKPR
ncbi:Transmembrane protein 81 [Galemys pyrenaicus]|uniref:Transmembrane protein 81 n=1 Tax=Galemys pyrenaicus TaxID=202257 RepID=A0A8J6AAU4_GALPY|nr:Transmembrane protein 81 [Galemys pyrenaicus]